MELITKPEKSIVGETITPLIEKLEKLKPGNEQNAIAEKIVERAIYANSYLPFAESLAIAYELIAKPATQRSAELILTKLDKFIGSAKYPIFKQFFTEHSKDINPELVTYFQSVFESSIERIAMYSIRNPEKYRNITRLHGYHIMNKDHETLIPIFNPEAKQQSIIASGYPSEDIQTFERGYVNQAVVRLGLAESTTSLVIDDIAFDSAEKLLRQIQSSGVDLSYLPELIDIEFGGMSLRSLLALYASSDDYEKLAIKTIQYIAAIPKYDFYTKAIALGVFFSRPFYHNAKVSPEEKFGEQTSTVLKTWKVQSYIADQLFFHDKATNPKFDSVFNTLLNALEPNLIASIALSVYMQCAWVYENRFLDIRADSPHAVILKKLHEFFFAKFPFYEGSIPTSPSLGELFVKTNKQTMLKSLEHRFPKYPNFTRELLKFIEKVNISNFAREKLQENINQSWGKNVMQMIQELYASGELYQFEQFIQGRLAKSIRYWPNSNEMTSVEITKTSFLYNLGLRAIQYTAGPMEEGKQSNIHATMIFEEPQFLIDCYMDQSLHGVIFMDDSIDPAVKNFCYAMILACFSDLVCANEVLVSEKVEKIEITQEDKVGIANSDEQENEKHTHREKKSRVKVLPRKRIATDSRPTVDPSTHKLTNVDTDSTYQIVTQQQRSIDAFVRTRSYGHIIQATLDKLHDGRIKNAYGNRRFTEVSANLEELQSISEEQIFDFIYTQYWQKCTFPANLPFEMLCTLAHQGLTTRLHKVSPEIQSLIPSLPQSLRASIESSRVFDPLVANTVYFLQSFTREHQVPKISPDELHSLNTIRERVFAVGKKSYLYILDRYFHDILQMQFESAENI